MQNVQNFMRPLIKRLLIGSGLHGPDIIEKYGFVQVNRFDYEKWVGKGEVEKIEEVKVPIWRFPAP